MEQNSMSNIWNSNCIMQARHSVGRSDERWGMVVGLITSNQDFLATSRSQ